MSATSQCNAHLVYFVPAPLKGKANYLCNTSLTLLYLSTNKAKFIQPFDSIHQRRCRRRKKVVVQRATLKSESIVAKMKRSLDDE